VVEGEGGAVATSTVEVGGTTAVAGESWAACEPNEADGNWLIDDRALRSYALGNGGTGGMSSSSSRPVAEVVRSRWIDSPSLCAPEASLDALLLRTILGAPTTETRVPAVLVDGAVE
jgi:hypothetical protein